MLEEEVDLSFADFGSPRRPYTAPIDEDEIAEAANYANSMARREGLKACFQINPRPHRFAPGSEPARSQNATGIGLNPYRG